MLSIKTTDVIEHRADGNVCNSEIEINGSYNRLLGEYEALSICLINKIFEDCGDAHNIKLMFANDFAEILENVGSHLLKEVKNA